MDLLAAHGNLGGVAPQVASSDDSGEARRGAPSQGSGLEEVRTAHHAMHPESWFGLVKRLDGLSEIGAPFPPLP